MEPEPDVERRTESDVLFQDVYSRLRDIASRYLANERKGHTLQPTALVHEAYLRVVGSRPPEIQDHLEYCEAVARAMRRILVDHARKRSARKRGGQMQRISLYGTTAQDLAADALDVVAVDEALSELAGLNARHARVVELRYFAGMSIEETAEVLGVSEWTVKNDWRVARAWLKVQLQSESS